MAETKQDYIIKEYESKKPLIELLEEFPDAHSLHSPFSDGLWNRHALNNLLSKTEELARNGEIELTEILSQFKNISDIYKKILEFEKKGINCLNYSFTRIDDYHNKIAELKAKYNIR